MSNYSHREKNSLQVKRLTYAALYLAIAMVLPFITGQIRDIGRMLCPMHLPVMLCGFMCGWPWGLAVGFIAPPLRAVMFGMPTLFPDSVAMAFELAVYGGMTGLLHRVLPPKPVMTYAALVISMIAGRIVWGLAWVVLSGLGDTPFTWEVFVTRGITSSIPGIILQLVLIPILVIAVDRAGLSLNRD